VGGGVVLGQQAPAGGRVVVHGTDRIGRRVVVERQHTDERATDLAGQERKADMLGGVEVKRVPGHVGGPGGSGADGTVFSISTGGSQFQSLYSFSSVNSGNGTNADGAIPDGDLVLTGNSLYGTTYAGGFGAAGTVFSLALPALPATITGIIINPDGSATLSFLGTPNSTNVIQSTTDLTSGQWQNISTNTAAALTGVWNFTDTTAGLSPVQFYRSYSR